MPAVAELNPNAFFLSGYLSTHASGRFGLADYGEAAALYRQAERATPNLPLALMGLITSLWHNGERQEAEETAQLFLANNPEFRLKDVHLPPWRDQETMDRYVAGLREAGLPE
jgi:tetratricopeptide (TPR) repeat protein